MSAGRKPGSSEGSSGAAAVDPQAPTQTSLRSASVAPTRGGKKAAPGAFAPDAPTKIMPPSPSLEEGLRGYNPDAATQATNFGGLIDDDPFAPRATDVELPSFSSEDAEVEGTPLVERDDVARVDLRPPAWRPPTPELDDADGPDDIVEISLSDMDALSDAEALPEIADDDSDEDTHDTVINLALPASLHADADDERPSQRSAAPPARTPLAPSAAAAKPTAEIPQPPPLPTATVVERRSHSPAALFDDDTASVTDPHREASPSHASDDDHDDNGAADASSAHRPPALASERTAARPSLASHPSGDPAPMVVGGTPAGAAPGLAAAAETPAYWDDADDGDDGDASEGDDADSDDEHTAAPEHSDVSDDALPPLLHRWKVVPTSIRELTPPPPPAPVGFGGTDRAKTLHTVLWSPDDEAEARAEHASQRARNPFWAPTDVGIEEPDSLLESTEAAAPSDPRHAAAAYIHDAVAYLRSLSHFAAHLDDEVRRDFESRLLGANEKLRRSLTVLHSAFGDDDADSATAMPADGEDDEG